MLNLSSLVPESWHDVLKDEFEKPYFKKLEEYLDKEYQENTIYPKQADLFSALELTPYSDIKVLLLGQDPYHGEGQAHGLSFSVQPGVAIPPSLKNMYKELQSDLGIAPVKHGSLISWAKQGMLLLNAVLSVKQATPNSHKSQGWEKFTDAIIKKVNEKNDPVVFVLWGNYAKKKASLIDKDRHIIIEGIHPSPLSASGGFFGSKPFSKINTALEKSGKEPINWQL